MTDALTQPSFGLDRPPLATVPLDEGTSASGRSTNNHPAVQMWPSARDRALSDQITQLDLEPVQRAYLSDRWLSEISYLSSSARRAQRWHERIRMLIVVGGVAITALAGLNLSNDTTQPFESLGFSWAVTVSDILCGMIFLLGLLVAVAAALEGSFRWGERWRHFHQQSELLRGEGWAYLELSGPNYERFRTHAEGFRTFVMRAENAIQQEVGVFIAQVGRSPEIEDPMMKYARSKHPTNSGNDAATGSARVS